MKITSNPFALPEVPVHLLTGPLGKVWFLRRGFVEPALVNEMIQSQQGRQLELSLLMLDASEALAKAKSISDEEARNMFAPQQMADGSFVEAQANPIDYLTREQRKQYLELANSGTNNLQIQVATALIQTRIMFALELAEDAAIASEKIKVKRKWFSPEVGQKYQTADGVSVEIKGIISANEFKVKPLASALAADDSIFLMEDAESYKVGMEGWKEADTNRFLGLQSGQNQAQIPVLYQFFLEERSAASEEETEGNEIPEISETASQSQLTGKASITDSSSLDAEIQDLPIIEAIEEPIPV
jgi:hypothetical protein